MTLAPSNEEEGSFALRLAQNLSESSIDATAVGPMSHRDLVAKIDATHPRPSVVVLDIMMPGVEDIAALVEELCLRAPVILLTSSLHHEAISPCLRAGAIAVLSKNESSGTIIDEIRLAVESGATPPEKGGRWFQSHGRLVIEAPADEVLSEVGSVQQQLPYALPVE